MNSCRKFSRILVLLIITVIFLSTELISKNAIFYNANPLFEIRSSESLQTIPGNKTILIYDGTGELSACMAAYLRVLGYNAQTLLFGANQLFYSRMIDDPELMEFVFSSARIKNYPYVPGE